MLDISTGGDWLDHLDGSIMFGTGFDDQRSGANQPVETCTFFQSDDTGAENLPADVAGDTRSFRVDWIEKLYVCAFLDPEVSAMYRSDDAAVAADDEIAGALNRTGEFSGNG